MVIMQSRCEAGLQRCPLGCRSLFAKQQPPASCTPHQRKWDAAARYQLGRGARGQWPLRPQQPSLRPLRRGSSCSPAAAAAAAAAVPAAAAAAGTAAAAAGGTATRSLLASLLHAWHTNPAAVMLAAGAFVLGISLSVFLLAAIPATLAMRRTALAMEHLLHTVRTEVPDTASTLRLSGLEVADCIEQVSLLSNDLTEGVRSTARVITAAEQGVKQGVDLAGKAVTGYVVPKLRSSVPEARDKLQAALEERARMDYTAATLREVASTTKTAAQRLRMGLAALGLSRGAAVAVREIRRVVAAQGDGERAGGGGGRRVAGEGTYGQQNAAAWEEP